MVMEEEEEKNKVVEDETGRPSGVAEGKEGGVGAAVEDASVGMADSSRAAAVAAGGGGGAAEAEVGAGSGSTAGSVDPDQALENQQQQQPQRWQRHSDLFGLSTNLGYLWVSHTRGGGSKPVPYQVSRDAPLGVLVAADPMLARPLRQSLHGLLMRLLVDQEFKRDFALAFARLYEVSCCCWLFGYGCSLLLLLLYTHIQHAHTHARTEAPTHAPTRPIIPTPAPLPSDYLFPSLAFTSLFAFSFPFPFPFPFPFLLQFPFPFLFPFPFQFQFPFQCPF